MLDFYLLIPVYNNFEGLIRSLESVKYDFAKFEVLIVDDGSNETIECQSLRNRLSHEIKVNILRLSHNQGITAALNSGLNWIFKQNRKSLFIARLDCGDICSPDRFYKQVKFLQSHPEIDIVGSWCIFKSYTSNIHYQYTTPTDHHHIVRTMHFKNVFIHPTVLWRTNVLKEKYTYPDMFPYTEDYALFFNILQHGKGAILPCFMVISEINPQGISLSKRQEQLKSRIKIVKYYGSNKILSILGIIKLNILRTIPYKLALQLKAILYRS